MAGYLMGLVNWDLKRDKEGHRDYLAEWLIESNDVADGPTTIFNTPGLPIIGSWWTLGNDIDLWAFCHPDWSCQPVVSKEINNLWLLSQVFSTRPLRRCQDSSIDNPVNEPPRISGTFQKARRLQHKNRHNAIVRSSSLEPFGGKEMEFDNNTPSVNIGLTMLTLPLITFAPMIDTVNDSPVWGLPERCVKLSNAPFQRHLYGTCSYYFTVDYQFDIDYETFDRKIPDKGTKVLRGWNPQDPVASRLNPDGTVELDPNNFVTATDRYGNPIETWLDGQGRPVGLIDDVAAIDVEYYNESNFYDLGIPVNLESGI